MAVYLDDAGNAAAQSRRLFTDAFAGMEDSLVSFVKTGKLDFKSLVDSIITDIIRIQVQRSIMLPLMGTGKDGDLGIMGNIASWVGDLFGGGRAVGGSVEAGKFYMVGERGPELLYAGSSGTVVPNHALGGASIEININNAAAGTQASATTRQGAGGKTIVDVLVEQLEGRMAGNVARGGGLAPVMESRYGLNPAAGAWR